MNANSTGAIDLHSHTTVSDGNLSPEGLIEKALERKLSALAITDHDQLAAILPAREAAGKQMEVIAGVEVSSAFEESTLHILGLFVDPAHAGLRGYLQEVFEARKRRAKKMVERLQKIGVAITLEEILESGKGAAVGRNHVAQVLLRKGIVNSRKEAFERFLKKGCPAYVPYEHAEPQKALSWIRAAGGRSFLAHPVLVRDQSLIPKLVEWGLNGLEVIHPEHGPGEIERYSKFCRERKLLRSGGSDYHGPNMERKGDLGMMKVPREFLDEIRASL